jgi:hypothetical protein
MNKFIQWLKEVFLPTENNNYRPRFLESRVLVYCVVVLFLLKLFTLPFFILFSKNIFFAAIVESMLIKLTNQERQSLGMAPLKENPQLKQAALFKAKDMLEKNYFAHQSPQGISPWYWFKIAGYNYKFAGENLAIGFLDSEQVYSAWLKSPGHRANILNPSFKEIGIAVLNGNFQGNQTTVVVQLFGTPSTFVSAPKQSEFQNKIPATTEFKNQGQKEVTEVASQAALDISTQGEFEKELGVKEKNLILGFLSFMTSDFYNFLQKFIYGFLIIIILALLLNIFIRLDIQHPDLILKTFFFILLLFTFLAVDKVDMVNFISRNFAIY